MGGVLHIGSEGRGAVGAWRGVGEAPVPFDVAARGVEGGTLRIKVTSRQSVMKVADAVGDAIVVGVDGTASLINMATLARTLLGKKKSG